MDEIEPVDFPLNKTNLTVNVKCESCRHFKGVPAPGLHKVCFRLGIIEESKPCRRYAVAANQIKSGDDRYIRMLAIMIKNIPKKKLHMAAALLIQEHHTRVHGYSLGDRVYFVVAGGSYLKNYRAGWVVAADKDYVYVSAKKNDTNFSLSLMHSSIVKSIDWKERRLQLISQKRIDDPNLAVYRSPKSNKALAAYVPPTIDQLADDRVKAVAIPASRRGVDVMIKDGIKTISIRRKA